MNDRSPQNTGLPATRRARDRAEQLLARLDKPMTALVVGATGGLGSAFAKALSGHHGVEVIGTGRTGPAVAQTSPPPGHLHHPLDLGNEKSIEELSAFVSKRAPLRLLLVASGTLHDAERGLSPEKRLADLEAPKLHDVFATNAAGPLILISRLAPCLPRTGRSLIGVLSARVGSIEDNRLGGWYSYRCSKAALNQGLRTAAIELRRTHPQLVCAALHPGTVDTCLSKPYQSSVGADQLLTPPQSAAALLKVLAELSPGQSGTFNAWDGQKIPW